MISISFCGSKMLKGEQEKIQNFTCENCGSRDTTEAACYRSYFHIFFIPVFPNERQFVTQCLHCGHIHNISPKKDWEFRYLYKKYHTPLWTWVGMPIYIAFFAWCFYFKFLKK